ncbi:hypothetical protein Tco_0644516 [Tanacetum coccineum]
MATAIKVLTVTIFETGAKVEVCCGFNEFIDVVNEDVVLEFNWSLDVLSGGGGVGGVGEGDSVEVILVGSVGVLAIWVGELVFGLFGFVVGESAVDVLLDVWGMEAGMKVIKKITLLIVWVANEDCWRFVMEEFKWRFVVKDSGWNSVYKLTDRDDVIKPGLANFEADPSRHRHEFHLGLGVVPVEWFEEILVVD